MDVREKLEVIAHLGDHISYKEDIGICCDSALAKVIEDAYMTLKNSVTVQDGKPLEAFLHPIDAYKGLKAKYLVFKADTGEMVDNCFILRPDKEHAAVEALRAYAKATNNEILAEDIYNWVGKGVTVQGDEDINVPSKWISVKERLPDRNDTVIAFYHTMRGTSGEMQIHKAWAISDTCTHWMHLPEPPKGE